MLVCELESRQDENMTAMGSPFWTTAPGGDTTTTALETGNLKEIESSHQNIHLSSPPDTGVVLSLAAEKGYAGIVQSILEIPDVDPNIQIRNGRTPLCLAAEQGHEEVVAALLRNQAVDPNLRDTVYDQSPLSWAAEKGNAEVIQFLLARTDIDRDSQDLHGQTPVSWAAEKGHHRILDILLDAGASPDVEDTAGRRPLLWASEYDHVEAVRVFIERRILAGIDVDE
ncbi:ankyrin repeat-containing domain protein [Aspergillus californicus]